MNESVFKEILGEALERELSEHENAPEHKFSLKHKLAMKRVFAKYERNVSALRKNNTSETARITERKPAFSLKRRVLIAMVIVILMSFLMGSVFIFVSEKFHGTVYPEYTRLIAVDDENCPQTIEYRYVPASVPDGFEMTETDLVPTSFYTAYKNKQTEQEITFCQWVKSHYHPHINTEHHELEEITVNGKKGLYIDFSKEGHPGSLLVLDNEDYILEIVTDFSLSETIKLANFNKV